MKVCIFGAGAIGGFLGTRLAVSGQARVSAVARGATRAALMNSGWRLRQEGELLSAPIDQVAERAEDLGPQDLVVIAVKGPAMPSVAASIAPLLGPGTVVLPAMNGVPWWFNQGVEALGPEPLHSVDPGGRIHAAIDPGRIIGCVVHASTSTPEPGLVEHRMGRQLIVGEPTGAAQDRTRSVAGLLGQAGFDVQVSDNIRHDIWYKLWGNMTINPISAITGATADRILDDPQVRALCTAAMREAGDIGARLGCAIEQSPDDRHAVTRKLGAFRTSMLQDAKAGRPIELDAIVGAPAEIAHRLGLSTPAIDALLGLTRLFGQVHGLYPPPVPGERG